MFTCYHKRLTDSQEDAIIADLEKKRKHNQGRHGRGLYFDDFEHIVFSHGMYFRGKMAIVVPSTKNICYWFRLNQQAITLLQNYLITHALCIYPLKYSQGMPIYCHEKRLKCDFPVAKLSQRTDYPIPVWYPGKIGSIYQYKHDFDAMPNSEQFLIGCKPKSK